MSKGLHLIREWETLRFEGDHIIFIVLRVCTIEKITTLQCFWLQPSMSLRLYWALVASNLDRRKRMMSCYQVSFYCIIIHPTHTLIEDVKPFIDSAEILHQNLFIVLLWLIHMAWGLHIWRLSYHSLMVDEYKHVATLVAEYSMQCMVHFNQIFTCCTEFLLWR